METIARADEPHNKAVNYNLWLYYLPLDTELLGFNIELNDEISQGDRIGLVGRSEQSTSPHLHFEIRKDENFVNSAEIITFP